jgi:hypothetical protein
VAVRVARPRLWERKKGRRKKKGGRAGPVDSALPRQEGWRGKPAAPVHVARQAWTHAYPTRHAWPAWHPCRVAACGVTKAVCRATAPGAAKGVTGCKENFAGVNFINKF